MAPNEFWIQVPSTCKRLLWISKELRRSYGNSIGGYILLLLPYYSRRIQDMFGSLVALKIIYIYYLLRLITLLILGAQVHAEVRLGVQFWHVKFSI